MSFELIITILSALLIAVGIIGIVYPVLPGSFAILAGLLLWSLCLQSAEAWWALGLGGTILLVGMSAQFILTGRTLKREKIPNKSTLLAALAAVVGMFLIPVLGLFIGFALGLLLSELYRQKSMTKALPSTLSALKSMGLGMLLELGCALLAASIFTGALIIYYATP
ncbi:MAG: DUF456 domain-containing protein [Rothia sp. (in: high G+C Gram-positive bacteria)]|nr:DUF456 domain-containing protein [Rothia sp. (in: high G+C Gram-positive bacteria)]